MFNNGLVRPGLRILHLIANEAGRASRFIASRLFTDHHDSSFAKNAHIAEAMPSLGVQSYFQMFIDVLAGMLEMAQLHLGAQCARAQGQSGAATSETLLADGLTTSRTTEAPRRGPARATSSLFTVVVNHHASTDEVARHV